MGKNSGKNSGGLQKNMKESLLNFILCPKCKSRKFNIAGRGKNATEIREGRIICKKCGYKMIINKGVLDCLYNPSQEILKEIKENRSVAEKRKNKGNDWILALPVAENFGNEKCMEINKGYLANVKFAVKKTDLKGKKVLDLGSGTCWTTNILAKVGAKAIATDISAEKFVGLSSADIFIKKGNIYFEKVLCSMDKLPFQDKKFDAIISNAAVHHSPDIKKTFSEIKRLLKKGGLYIQTNEPVCSIFNFSKKIDIKKARKKGMDVVGGWNENAYSYTDYKGFLKKNSLKGKFLFPPSFDAMLSNKESLKGIKGYKYLIGVIMNRVWGFRPFKRLFIWAFPVSLVLFGGSFVLIAKKW